MDGACFAAGLAVMAFFFGFWVDERTSVVVGVNEDLAEVGWSVEVLLLLLLLLFSLLFSSSSSSSLSLSLLSSGNYEYGSDERMWKPVINQITDFIF